VKVSDVGEFRLIQLLARELGRDFPVLPGAMPRPGLAVDLGDDAAVGERRTGAAVWTTDTLVAGVHFLPDKTSWQATGWKALAVNASDIAAMGAVPDLALVTLALPTDFETDDAVTLYRGLQEAANAFGVLIAGGDIVRAPVFSVTVALSGWAYETELGQPVVMRRSDALPGDIIAISGFLGDAAAGLQLLQEGVVSGERATARLIDAQQRPQPRLAVGHEAIELGVRCAIDVSDGLLQDLGHVAQASGVSIRIEATRLPISSELEAVFPGRAAGMALTGGEDYELVLIGAQPIIERLLRSGEVPITEIGEVMAKPAGKVAVVDESGREIPYDLPGWDHLRSNK
jgi:thiamine-monophosphate kinase